MQSLKKIMIFGAILGLVLVDLVLLDAKGKSSQAQAQQTCVSLKPSCHIVWPGGGSVSCAANEVMMATGCWNGGDHAIEGQMLSGNDATGYTYSCRGDKGHDAHALCCKWQ
jgi:hypothetical protein